ncbi:MAG: hypothetical protein EB829_01370 [Nitrosopumilus sp. H8]|nr:MAG: hypothetical protein EB829_01370 [Nitrosopumilus sp. H8]
MPNTIHVAILLAVAVSLFVASPEVYALSPHVQLESGIPLEEIQCTDEKILLESPRGTPACVWEPSVEKLVQRGFVLVPQVMDKADADKPVDAMPKDADKPAVTDDSDISSNSTVSEESKQTLNIGEINIPEEDRVTEVIIFKTNADHILNFTDAIPQDDTYDYDLKMSPTDTYEFAQLITSVANDKIIETRTVDGNYDKFITERIGGINIYKNSGSERTTYTLKDKIHPSEAEEFVYKMLAELGVEPDETEILDLTDEPPDEDFPDRVNYGFWQKLNGEGVYLHSITFDFTPFFTYIVIGSWISDIEKYDLIPRDLAKISARSYAVLSEELQGPDCKIKYYDRSIVQGIEFRIIDGRPMYVTYSGSCTVPHQIDVGHDLYNHYWAYIDAVTGKPLFVQERVYGNPEDIPIVGGLS